MGAGRQGLMRECMGLDGVPSDEVFPDDDLEDIRGAVPVPRALGIDHGHGAMDADLEAIGLGAGDERARADEAEFLESPLEELPGFKAGGWVAALGLAGRGAEEDVALEGVRDRRERGRGRAFRRSTTGTGGGIRCVHRRRGDWSVDRGAGRGRPSLGRRGRRRSPCRGRRCRGHGRSSSRASSWRRR